MILTVLVSFIYLSMYAQTDFELLSQDFLYAVRVGDNYDKLEADLATVLPEDLKASLSTENKKKAFWLNLYNAYIQIKAKAHPEMIKESRGSFFSEEWITIAGKEMSFDDIEHGMLRHSQWKYGMGYIGAWFPGSFEKDLRVDEVDYRIHFALNCGAKGCPPIAYYQADRLDENLEMAASGFLSLNSNYNEEENIVEVSKILSWFKGDFGGTDGTIEKLKHFEIIPADSKPKIKYLEYDWTLSLNNYID